MRDRWMLTKFHERQYAGFLINSYEEVPVFHAYGRTGDEDYSLCSRVVTRASHLPITHLLKFARPCRICWKVADD